MLSFFIIQSNMAQASDRSEIKDNDSISKKIQEKLTINEPLSDEKTSNQDEHLQDHQNTNVTYQETNDNVDNTNDNSFTLMELPPELILLIFSFIEARFTMTVLFRVCKFFNQLLLSEASWKTRFGKRWPKRDRKEDYEYVIR